MAITTSKFGSLDFSKSPISLNNVGNGTYAVEFGDYLYVPETTINKGVTDGSTQYYFPYFLNQDNLNTFAKNAESINLSSLPYGDVLSKNYGVSGSGYLIPKSKSFDTTNASVPAGWGSITGLSMKDGQLVYGTTGRSGDRYGWISNSGVGSQPPPKRSGGILGLVEDVGSALVDAAPIVKLAALVSGNPYLYAVSAGTDIAQGNYLGAAVSLVGAGGNIPGVDAATAADLKTAQTTLQVANAIKNDNPIAALSALGAGSGIPNEVKVGSNLLAINSALQRGDLSALAVAAGNISNTPELSYAGKAANVVKAIETGDINKVATSLQGFLPELRSAYKSGDITSAFDKIGYKLSDSDSKSLDTALTTPVDTLVKSGVDTINDNTAKAGGWDNYAQLQDATALGIGSKDQYTAYKAAEAQAAEEALAAQEAERVRVAQAEADRQAAAQAEAEKQAAANQPPAGTQIAGPVPGDVFKTDIGGTPIYGGTSRADTVKPPFGYDLLPIDQADNKPEGSYYDPTQNAWFMPNQDAQNLQKQLQGGEEPGTKTETGTPGKTETDTTLPDIFYYDDGSYKVTNKDGTSTVFNADGTIHTETGTTGGETDTGLPGFDAGSLGGESDLAPTDQGGSLGDESDLPPTGDKGSLGDESDMPPEEEPQCAPGYHWNGSVCVSDTDVEDRSTTCPEGYLFDFDTQTCVLVGTTPGGGTKPGGTPGKTPTGTPKTPTGTPTDTTKPPGTTVAPPPTKTPGLNANTLAALLALDERPQQQQMQPTPLADIKYYYDFGDMLPQKPQNTQGQPAQFEFFDGGEVQDFSVDDLIQMLKGD